MAIIWEDGKTEWEGYVLNTRELNFIEESDFYALVYDETEDKIKKIQYDSTRYAGNARATIDAPQYVHEKAKSAWISSQIEGYRERTLEYLKKPKIGARIKVVRGRTNKRGRTGIVTWIKTYPNKYRKGTVTLVFFEPDDDKGEIVRDYERNVEVIDYEMPSNDELIERLRSFAERGAYLRFDYKPAVIIV